MPSTTRNEGHTPMTVDHSIDYSFASKGARRRQRLRPADTPEPAPYRPKPKFENRPAKQFERQETGKSVVGVKTRIRQLVIYRDASVDDISDVMEREGSPVSRVTIGNLRRELRDIVKLLEKEGLLNTDALARRRRRIKARERSD